MVVGSCEDNIVRVDGLNGGGNTNVVRSISTIFSVDSKKYLIDQIVKNGIVSKNDLKYLKGLTIKELEKVCRYEILITEIVGKNIDFCVILKISSNLSEEKLKIIKDNKELILEIAGIDSLSVRDLDNYGKTLSKLTRKDLEKIRSIKDLIEEITGDRIDIAILGGFGDILGTLPREKLEELRYNKDLIKEITGENSFGIVDFIYSFGKLIELTRKDLENVMDNRRLFLKNVGGDGNIGISSLYSFSKLTRNDIEGIGDTKILIKEITGDEVDELNDYSYYLSFKKEELEGLRDNKNLILDITGESKIYGFYFNNLIGITKTELLRIKDNKTLILEITGKNEINLRDLETLTDLTKEDLEKIRDNKDLILEIIGKNEIDICDLKALTNLTKEDLEEIRDNKDLILEIIGEDEINVCDLKELANLTKEQLEKINVLCKDFGINIPIRSGSVDGIFGSELFGEYRGGYGKYLL